MPKERPSATAEDLLRDALAAEILRLNPEAGAAGIDPDVALLDSGYLDSLTAAELLAAAEARWGVHVSVDRLVGDLPTLRALAAWLAAETR